eukprot:4442366-Prymnesium_polylepis.1
MYGGAAGPPDLLCPLDGIEYRLVRSEGDEEGEGELVFMGCKSAMTGYLSQNGSDYSRTQNGIAHHADDLDPGGVEYSTRDCFRTEVLDGQTWLRYLCRRDDVLNLSSGELANPIPTEQVILAQCPTIVQAASMVGSNRARPALLIELCENVDAEAPAVRAELLAGLKVANAAQPAYAFVTAKNLFTVAPGTLPRTVKGTVMRRKAELLLHELESPQNVKEAPSDSTVAASGASAAAVIPLDSVLQIARGIAGDDVDADAPLMEAGIDSLGAVEMIDSLQQSMRVGAALPSTLLFDYPTVRQLAATFAGAKDAPFVAAASSSGRSSDDVTLLGPSALMPCNTTSPSAAQCLSVTGFDAIGQVPVSRWDVASHKGLDESVASRARHGGFVPAAPLFDAYAFLISSAEAAAMDPQQRLLLECGYCSLHASGLDRVRLAGSSAAVCVGIGTHDFSQVLTASPAGGSVYAATGASYPVASGRLSYMLGLHGPCVSYDTACSAALVACHGALRAIQFGECTTALAAASMLMLTPALCMSFAIAGMTSPNGRSHTFDVRANGYARGE